MADAFERKTWSGTRLQVVVLDHLSSRYFDHMVVNELSVDFVPLVVLPVACWSVDVLPVAC